MNCLYVGTDFQIRWPKSGYLCFVDKLPKRLPKPRRSREDVRVFDPLEHRINPLDNIRPVRARELAKLFYIANPNGKDTLTVRNGRRALRDALMRAEYLDQIPKDNRIPKDYKEEVRGMIGDVLFNPVIKQVLCNPTNFSFNPNSVILARLDRKELGDDDALLLGLLLMSLYEGQLVIPAFDFYGRDIHSRLIYEERLIAGVHFLDELPDALRQSAMLIKQKVLSGTTVEDAEEIIKYERPKLVRDTDKYATFIENAIA